MELSDIEAPKKGRPPGSSRRPSLPGFRSECEQAERYGITVVTLRRWNREGKGARPIKVGRQNMYRVGDDERLLAQQLDVQASEPRGRGRPRKRG